MIYFFKTQQCTTQECRTYVDEWSSDDSDDLCDEIENEDDEWKKWNKQPACVHNESINTQVGHMNLHTKGSYEKMKNS